MIRSLLCILLEIYQFVVIAHVIMSWVPRPPEPIMPFVRLLRSLVEPVVAPIRRVVPPARFGGVALDLSIIILFVVLYLLQLVICR
jgi:YggT family protein